MHHLRRESFRVRLFVVVSLATSLWVGSTAAAGAVSCGDLPADNIAKAAVRAAIATQCPCSAATDRGDYIRCAKNVIAQATSGGTLPSYCASTLKKCVTKSTCGRPAGWVTCCRTTAAGRTKCSVKSSPAKCRSTTGGGSCTTGFSSCCDACTAAGCVTPVPSNTPALPNTPRPTNRPTMTPGVPPTSTPTLAATPTIPPICQSMVGLPPIAQVPITLGQGTTQCGGVSLQNPPPAPPLSGFVEDGAGTKLGDLGVGCLYAGALPALMLPSGSTAKLDVVGLNLLPLSITLSGSAGSGATDCTRGAGPGRKCANGLPGLDGTGTCNGDSDCGNQRNACAPEPNCYFGPPIPVPNGGLAACVVNAFLTDLCGRVDLVPPQATFATALSSRVYLTLDANSPCPRCESGICNGGDRDGLGCTPVGPAQTSIECPPRSNTFLSTLTVVVPQLTSGVSDLTAPDGFFCEGQKTAGAFGLPGARSVTEMGTSPSLSGLSLSMNLAATFCIAPTGTFLDSIAGLPTVGGLAAAGQVDITSLLLP